MKILALLALAVPTFAVQTGVLVQFSESGFAFFGNQAVNMALEDASHLTIPAQSGKFQFLGDFKYELSDFNIGHITCGTPKFSFSPAVSSIPGFPTAKIISKLNSRSSSSIDYKKGLQEREEIDLSRDNDIAGDRSLVSAGGGGVVHAVIPGCSSSASLNFHVMRESFPEASCSGDATVRVSDFTTASSVTVSEKNGAILVSEADVKTSIGDVKMDFGGDCSLLVDAIKKIIEEAVKKTIDEKLGPQISSSLNKALAKIHYPTSFTKDAFVINTVVTSEPVVTSSVLAMTGAGIVNAVGHPPYNGTCSPLPKPSSVAGSSMVNIDSAECVFDSIGASAMANNYLSVQKAMTIFGMPFTVGVKASEPPKVKLTAASKYAHLQLAAEVFLNATGFDVFIALDTSVDLPVKMGVAHGNITGSLGNITMQDLDVKVTIKDSKFAPINVTEVAKAVNIIGDTVVLPLLNKLLNRGFPIPTTEGVALENVKLTIGDGFLGMAAEFASVKKADFRISESDIAAQIPLFDTRGPRGIAPRRARKRTEIKA